MKHTEFKEWLCLSLYGELKDDEQRLLRAHLEGCDECRSEMEDLRLVHGVMDKSPIVVTERLVAEARTRLHSSLVHTDSPPSVIDAIAAFISRAIAPRYRIAVGAAAMATIGIFIGYIVFSPGAIRSIRQQPIVARAGHAVDDAGASLTAMPTDSGAVDRLPTADGASPSLAVRDGKEGTTANFRILHADARTGSIEFVYDEISPVHVSGNIHDEKVQTILVRTLREEDNPGVRLKAVGVLLTENAPASAIDPVLKSALLSSLRHDNNPAMRLAVLNVLRLHRREKEIQRAMATVAVNDRNSGVRVAAINCLAEARLDGIALDANAVAVLKQKLVHDKNIFIRTQTRNIIQEGTQL